MNIKYFLFLILMMMVFFPLNSHKAYMLFMKDGEKTTWNTFLYYAEKSDIILFGELHNNPISHWLQFELVRDLYKTKKGKVIVGAEMLETDDQLKIDEYFRGLYSRTRFESEIKLWPNYKTDYRPVVEYARKKKIRLIATNVPRRYASLVFNQGWDGLSQITPAALKYLAPLPVPFNENLTTYKKMRAHTGMMRHKTQHLAKAQALKDATMAHFILKGLQKGHTCIHLNGAYHSKNFEGIYWYLNKYAPEKKVLAITTVTQKDMSELSKKAKDTADFIIAVPASMPGSY